MSNLTNNTSELQNILNMIEELPQGGDIYILKSGGTFTGEAYAKSGVTTSAQLRNTALVNTETYPTVNGQINWQYE